MVLKMTDSLGDSGYGQGAYVNDELVEIDIISPKHIEGLVYRLNLEDSDPLIDKIQKVIIKETNKIPEGQNFYFIIHPEGIDIETRRSKKHLYYCSSSPSEFRCIPSREIEKLPRLNEEYLMLPENNFMSVSGGKLWVVRCVSNAEYDKVYKRKLCRIFQSADSMEAQVSGLNQDMLDLRLELHNKEAVYAALENQVSVLTEGYRQLNVIVNNLSMELRDSIRSKYHDNRGFNPVFAPTPTIPSLGKQEPSLPSNVRVLNCAPLGLMEIPAFIESIPEFSTCDYASKQRVIAAIMNAMQTSGQKEPNFLFLADHNFADLDDPINVRVVALQGPISNLTYRQVTEWTVTSFSIPLRNYESLRAGRDFVIIRTKSESGSRFAPFSQSPYGLGFSQGPFGRISEPLGPFYNSGYTGMFMHPSMREQSFAPSITREQFVEGGYFNTIIHEVLAVVAQECRTKQKNKYTSLVFCFGVNGTWDATEKYFTSESAKTSPRPMTCHIQPSGIHLGGLTKPNSTTKDVIGSSRTAILASLSKEQIAVIVNQLEICLAELMGVSVQDIKNLRVTTKEDQMYWDLKIANYF